MDADPGIKSSPGRNTMKHDRALAAATRGAKRGAYVYKQPKQLSYIVHCVISTVCHIRVVFLEPPSRSFWDVWL